MDCANLVLFSFDIQALIADWLVWLKANQQFAVVAIFWLGFAESIVLLAIVVPSTLLFAGIGAAYAGAGGSLELLWLAGALGAVCGDTTSYALGRWLRDDVPKAWPFRRYPKLFQRSSDIFRRWGWFAIILGKFTFGLRPLVPVSAGIVTMPLVHFILASLVSCVIWAGLALGFGYAAAKVLYSLMA